MNCTSFRKFAGAFADGELDVRQNLEALEHLNMCPACAARVEEVSRQRAALARLWSERNAPTSVHRRVCDALQRETEIGPWDPPSDTTASAAGRWRRRSLALAGAILASVVAWAVWPVVEPASAATSFVNAVREHHLNCRLWREGDFLDMEQVSALEKLTQETFGFRLAVPMLGRFHYRLRSGCLCNLKGISGVHLTYVVPESGERLSVFTTPRQPQLVPAPVDTSLHRSYYLSPNHEFPAVVAWHDEGRTVTVCGGMAPGALTHMFDQVLLARERLKTREPIVVLAGAGF